MISQPVQFVLTLLQRFVFRLVGNVAPSIKHDIGGPSYFQRGDGVGVGVANVTIGGNEINIKN